MRAPLDDGAILVNSENVPCGAEVGRHRLARIANLDFGSRPTRQEDRTLPGHHEQMVPTGLPGHRFRWILFQREDGGSTGAIGEPHTEGTVRTDPGDQRVGYPEARVADLPALVAQ